MPTTPYRLAVLSAALVVGSAATAQTVPPVSGLQHRFAPFVDATAWPLPDLTALSTNSGARAFVLGFIVNDGQTATRPCTPKWGGFDPYYATQAQATAGGESPHLKGTIDALRAAGGRVMISFGGAANSPIAATCTNAQSLANAYAEVMDTYGVNDLDFDIEGTWVADATSRARNVAGLVLLQQMRPNVRIWYTLPVLPTGLDNNGVATLNAAVAGGVNLSGVNIMAMDYGGSSAPDPSQLGAYAIQAMTALHGQIRAAYSSAGRPLSAEVAWTMVGVTPMIGVNDVATEVFQLSHAAQVRSFAMQRNIGLLSMWSIQRDLPCPGGPTQWPQTTCSSIAQQPYAFSALFREMDTTVEIGSTPEPGGTLALRPPQPNPALNASSIRFTTGTGTVRLDVFDVLGRRVAVLVDGAMAAGDHSVMLDTNRLERGVYVLRLEQGGTVVSRHIVVG